MTESKTLRDLFNSLCIMHSTTEGRMCAAYVAGLRKGRAEGMEQAHCISQEDGWSGHIHHGAIMVEERIRNLPPPAPTMDEVIE